MLLLTILCVIFVVYIFKVILKLVFGGAEKIIDKTEDAFNPKTTDTDASELIARAAQKAINSRFALGKVRVIEFIPKEKSLPIAITSSEDIELIKSVKENLTKWEITTLDKYKKNYWDGILRLDVDGESVELSARAVIYTDREDRGGIATCDKYVDMDYISSILEKQKKDLLITNDNKSPEDQLLDFSEFIDYGDESFNQTVEELCTWISAGENVESCLDGLARLASSHEKEWALSTHNTELFDQIKQKVQWQISNGEKFLFYKDGGIFSTGKSGLLITNKNIFEITKKGIAKLPLHEICTIHASLFLGSCSWHFNANENVTIDNMSCSPAEQGVILALICLLVQRCKGNDCKIKFYAEKL